MIFNISIIWFLLFLLFTKTFVLVLYYLYIINVRTAEDITGSILKSMLVETNNQQFPDVLTVYKEKGFSSLCCSYDRLRQWNHAHVSSVCIGLATSAVRSVIQVSKWQENLYVLWQPAGERSRHDHRVPRALLSFELF